MFWLFLEQLLPSKDATETSLQSSSISQPTKVEYCSCKTVSHDVVSGYIDPRALPEADDLSNLGRFIRHNACPNGQVLTCSDVPSHVSSNQDFAP